MFKISCEKGCQTPEKETYKVHAPISKEDVEILMAGGALNYIRNQQ